MLEIVSVRGGSRTSAKLCNEGLGAESPMGSRGKAPGAKVRGKVRGQRDEVPLKLMTFSYFRDYI